VAWAGVQAISALLAGGINPDLAPRHAGYWLDWRRRHQARACWCHQRTRFARDAE
jgi:hypothetical protein